MMIRAQIQTSRTGVVACLALLALALGSGACSGAGPGGHILIGKAASPIEHYAARELQRYLYQITGALLAVETAEPRARLSGSVFLLGRRESNPLIARLASGGQIQVGATEPGPQGYALKKLTGGGTVTLVIAGSDEVGCLYGVYGLLEDYFGVGFYLGGDVLPERKRPLLLPEVDEHKKPAVAIRGFLPWTNFPQSATSYSWEDWRFIIDQMAKMRMNFLHIHNYNGQAGHNEMFHNVSHEGITPRVWMATARSGHAWGGRPGWDPNQYRFGAADLFDDYDFGADCARHNETLSNEQVFRKGVSEFQKVIAYAHARGVKIGLGLDIDLLPPELARQNVQADDPQVIASGADQIITDYPDLDYLLCFQSETIGDGRKKWRSIFDGYYQALKRGAPRLRLAVAGWGIGAQDVTTLPPDVICAPISRYSDGCESGAVYGDREYWGCPWLERDASSSEYYYPYNMQLSNTIKAWQTRAPNMKGFYCLTWRLTDAIDPKISYVAKAPWGEPGKYASSEAVYRDYAERNYGPAAAATTTGIINQNEPFGSDFGECCKTPPFSEYGSGGFLLNVRWFSVHPRVATGPQMAATNYSQHEGTRNEPCGEGGLCVAYIEHGDWLRFDNVDFGAGADTFEARVAAQGQGAEIELRLGSLESPIMGLCFADSTGGWQNWITKATAIPPTSGKHTLFLKFRGRNNCKAEFAKAVEQLSVIDRCIAAAESPSPKARLQLLRRRIAAAKDHIELNQNFKHYTWTNLPGAMESWAQNFVYRVTDVSSLGNVVSSQNRFVQLNYVAKENQLRKGLVIQPPSAVRARGTPDGARLAWQNEEPKARGFNVYRDGLKLNAALLPPSASHCTDKADGRFRYSVTAVAADGSESLPAVPVTCEAGSADRTPPHIVVLSPPTSALEHSPVWIEARLLDNRSIDSLSATLNYRSPGAGKWKARAMIRRVGTVFVAQITGEDVGANGLEYYITASDGSNTAVFPVSAPPTPLSLVTCRGSGVSAVVPPAAPGVENQTLFWRASKDAFWYRVYRSDRSGFEPGPATFLTWLEKDTVSFRDNGFDLAGRKLAGDWYYRISAVDKKDHESAPTKPLRVRFDPESK